MSKNNIHWTGKSNEAFRYNVAFDFASQIEDRLKSIDWSQDRLANEIGVSKGRVSQLLNNPGNLTLNTMITMVRSLGMKLSVLPYDDGDPVNVNGPISSNVFLSCWVQLKKPHNMWDLEESISHHRIRTYKFHHVAKLDWHDKINISPGSCRIIQLSDRRNNRLALGSVWEKQPEKEEDPQSLTG